MFSTVSNHQFALQTFLVSDVSTKTHSKPFEDKQQNTLHTTWGTSPANEQFQSWRVNQSTNPSTLKTKENQGKAWKTKKSQENQGKPKNPIFPINLFGGPPGLNQVFPGVFSIQFDL